MKNTKKSLLLICSIVLIAGLVGCSKKDDTSNTADKTGTPNLADAMSQKGQEQAAISALPKGDANTPLSQYKELTSGSEIMFAYYALSSLPTDYDKVLSSYSQDYRGASDEFKKQDILKALKPKVDQEIASAKTARHLKMTWGRFNLGKYDFQAKGFPQSDLSNNSNFGWNDSDYRLAFTNADNFKIFKVEDEAKARLIEEKRSKYEELNLVVYVYAQDADLNETRVKAQVMKVSLQDKHGTELFSQ